MMQCMPMHFQVCACSGVMHYGAVWCIVVQYCAQYCVIKCMPIHVLVCGCVCVRVFKCVAVWFSVVQCGAVCACSSVLQCGSVWCSVVQCGVV